MDLLEEIMYEPIPPQLLPNAKELFRIFRE
jgi:hypothetical protein